jgi:hypothetical protein
MSRALIIKIFFEIFKLLILPPHPNPLPREEGECLIGNLKNNEFKMYKFYT